MLLIPCSSSATPPIPIMATTIAAPHLGDKPRIREVAGNKLVSRATPEATVVLPKQATYIGSTRFDLKGVADAEIHVFVEAGTDRVVDRAYWVQFESYLPHVPNAAYNFQKLGHPRVKLGNMDLYYSTGFGSQQRKPAEGSESEHVRSMISNAGYTMPAETFSAQFHQVASPDNRSEILIIVIGDLSEVGLRFDDILQGGNEGTPQKHLAARALRIAQRHVRIKTAEVKSSAVNSHRESFPGDSYAPPPE
jgi:hypothetical protein